MTPHKTLLEAAGGTIAYKEGTVLRSTRWQGLPAEGKEFGAIQVDPGDVAIIEKVEVYETMRPPNKQLHVTYDLLLLRTREVARDVPAYQIAVYWSVVDA